MIRAYKEGKYHILTTSDLTLSFKELKSAQHLCRCKTDDIVEVYIIDDEKITYLRVMCKLVPDILQYEVL